MPRRWSRGVDRILSDGLDGEYDRLKKTAKAHQVHDTQRTAKPARSGRTPNNGSAPASNNANTPQKRGWRR
ncbi:hypothetical protein AAW14_08735 [Streptomyces hygroscopicus]|uniref:hypothetical protein n=1 Tax=Streptomyces hygroscopicus TaxID=1912 RepID=UPI00223ECDF0|nr:hypothetical protein [Streptomyces hygroscopicus]MCW7942117.1 hypothetical protein [Streptomyces hygroscopicus]